jgi:hypothetical protein
LSLFQDLFCHSIPIVLSVLLFPIKAELAVIRENFVEACRAIAISIEAFWCLLSFFTRIGWVAVIENQVVRVILGASEDISGNLAHGRAIEDKEN